MNTLTYSDHLIYLIRHVIRHNLILRQNVP